MTTAALMHPPLRRNADFRRLLLGLAASQAGDWLYNVALAAIVWQRTGSAAWVGATTAARVVPIVLLGPIGGMIADRFDRRRSMIVSDVVRAGLMLALAAVVVLQAPIVLVPLLAAAATAAGSAFPTCASAVVRVLVPDHQLGAANAARTAVMTASIIAGPAVGAVLLISLGAAPAIAANAATFLLSAASVLSLGRRASFAAPGLGDTSGLVANVSTGVRALREAPGTLLLVGADTVGSAAYGVHTVALVLVARTLGLGPGGYGVLLAVFGAGGLLGSALAGRLANAADPRRLLVPWLLAVASPFLAIAVAPTLPVVLPALLAAGAGGVVVEVLAETALQRTLPDEAFGRAYGIALPMSLSAIAVGALVTPLAVHLVGLRGALLAFAVAIAAYALIVRPRPAAAPTLLVAEIVAPQA